MLQILQKGLNFNFQRKPLVAQVVSAPEGALSNPTEENPNAARRTICNILREQQLIPPNIPDEERKTLANIKWNRPTHFKTAGKQSVLVILNRSDYESKVSEPLMNGYYERTERKEINRAVSNAPKWTSVVGGGCQASIWLQVLSNDHTSQVGFAVCHIHYFRVMALPLQSEDDGGCPVLQQIVCLGEMAISWFQTNAGWPTKCTDALSPAVVGTGCTGHLLFSAPSEECITWAISHCITLGCAAHRASYCHVK